MGRIVKIPWWIVRERGKILPVLWTAFILLFMLASFWRVEARSNLSLCIWDVIRSWSCVVIDDNLTLIFSSKFERPCYVASLRIILSRSKRICYRRIRALACSKGPTFTCFALPEIRGFKFSRSRWLIIFLVDMVFLSKAEPYERVLLFLGPLLFLDFIEMVDGSWRFFSLLEDFSVAEGKSSLEI